MKLLSLITISLIVLIACDDTLTVQDIDNKIIPSSNVSFADHIYPVLQVKCAFSGCHSSVNPGAGLDLTSWSGVTADPTIVFPGEPDLSKLIWAIEGNKPPIQPMPPIGYRSFTQNQVQGMRKWIEEGALDN
ncbi:MAG TPA: hypothetical protein DHV28_18035 [Ignavibacteriales bacterium]|nr:hypothetical protein [Ignavibacteriales bacterium]